MPVMWMNVLYAAGGIVLFYLVLRVAGLLTPQIDVVAELKRGNVAIAIFVAAFVLGVAIVIAGALS
jgi:uncharacterized membrane protein YjfL (UPF0719 family)